MSRRPIARSTDLQRLENEGYAVEIRAGYLLVKDVPYVDAQRHIRYGILFVKLELAGDVATKPLNHVAYWTGEHPCHNDGTTIASISNPSCPQNFGTGLQADFTFSAKADYRDYHHQVTTYIGRITGEAAVIDPNVSAQTFPAIPADAGDSVFKYIDTATSRAGIGILNDRIAGQRIGIIGVGGTGAYVLDLIAKTPVAEIHLFDRDVFSQHNAFRAPGAPTLEQLASKPQKVTYLSSIYSNMRHGIIAHDIFLTPENVNLLSDLDFVFVCMDRGEAKRVVVKCLIASMVPFVEVGMGLFLTDSQLGGIVRVTTSTNETRDKAAPHISYATESGNNAYASNIQIAELNALNASLAVIRWKKLFGVYQDARDDYYAGFTIAGGAIVTESLK